MLLLILIVIASITYSVYVTAKYAIMRNALLKLTAEFDKLLDELSKIKWGDF